MASGIDDHVVSRATLVFKNKNYAGRLMTILGWSPVIQAPRYIICSLFAEGCDGLRVPVVSFESCSRNQPAGPTRRHTYYFHSTSSFLSG